MKKDTLEGRARSKKWCKKTMFFCILYLTGSCIYCNDDYKTE